MSQGAGMAIWLGAWCPIVRAVCSDMPFLAGINDTLGGSVSRYPLKELFDFMQDLPVGEARLQHTVSYFDTINHATHCDVPTLVSLGLRDPASKPDNVRVVYDALPGLKKLQIYEGGHDWDAGMVEVNRNWLLDSLISK